MKTKKKRLIIEFPATASVPASVPGSHIKIARRQVKETLKHFKEDGWDLDFHSLIDFLGYEILGYHLEALLLSQFTGKGFIVKQSGERDILPGRLVLSPAKGRRRK